MAKAPSKKQREWWERVRELGCIVASNFCVGEIQIHHCETGAGGRKDHDKVIPLCWNHHVGALGIHRLSRRIWQEMFAYERDLMVLVARELA